MIKKRRFAIKSCVENYEVQFDLACERGQRIAMLEGLILQNGFCIENYTDTNHLNIRKITFKEKVIRRTKDWFLAFCYRHIHKTVNWPRNWFTLKILHTFEKIYC